MNKLILYAELITALILIISILLQQRGTALGAAFGSEGGTYATRRGIQKKIFWISCLSGAAFIILALVNLAI
ncbi:preprotein translocase subunit SecG [bacterium]|nr:preprotein translocase subunit SecG [bacterium]